MTDRQDQVDVRALFDRLRQGDERAFDVIFRTWYAPLVRLAEKMLRNQAKAEEAVQEVMLEIWRRREQIASDGSPSAYLFQATRNRALNILRRERLEDRTAPEIVFEEASERTGVTDLIEEEIDVALRAAVAELPPRARQVFELSRVNGLKYAEIAEALGVSVKAVEANMGRALRILRVRLAPWLPKGDTL